MSEVLHQVTQAITADDLPRMVLSRTNLPAPLRDFLPARSGFLDNHSLAEQGLPGSTADRFREVGRLTGYLQEFLPAAPESKKIPPGFILAASTVVHLFDDMQSVSRWIEEVFLRDFESRLDEEIHPGQHLLVAERLQFDGFADETAGLRVLQSSPRRSRVVDGGGFPGGSPAGRRLRGHAGQLYPASPHATPRPDAGTPHGAGDSGGAGPVLLTRTNSGSSPMTEKVPDTLSLNDIETIEELTSRWIFQTVYDFGMEAYEIFLNSPDSVKDIAENITRELLDRLAGFNVQQRIYGTVG